MAFKLTKKQREYYRIHNKQYYWENKNYRKEKVKRMAEYYYDNPEYFRKHRIKQWKKTKKDPILRKINSLRRKEWGERNKERVKDYYKRNDQAKFLEKVNVYRKTFGLKSYKTYNQFLKQKQKYIDGFEETNRLRGKQGYSPFQCIAQYKAFLAKKKGVCLQQLRY